MYQGNEPEPVGQELVAEDGWVCLKLNPVDGHGRGLGDHHSTNRVGHAHVRVLQLELHQLVGQFWKVVLTFNENNFNVVSMYCDT